jgi:hypothetical protein
MNMFEAKEMRVVKDGNCWMFVLPDFINLQESPSVWTDPGDIELDYIYNELTDPRKNEISVPEDWDE